MGKLTTHILDTASGRPAAGVVIELHRRGPARESLVTARTNARRPLRRPAARGSGMQPGEYELTFQIGDYFRGIGVKLPEPPFLGAVVIRVCDRRSGRALPRAAARLAVELLDLPRQLRSDESMNATDTIRFVLDGRIVEARGVSPTTTLLAVPARDAGPHAAPRKAAPRATAARAP